MEDFEKAFQRWLDEGSFTKPALREDLDREMRQEGIDKMFEKAKKVCPHGLSELSCSKCYFEGPGYAK